MCVLLQFHALLPHTLFYHHRSTAHNIIIHQAFGRSKLASSEPRLSEYLIPLLIIDLHIFNAHIAPIGVRARDNRA